MNEQPEKKPTGRIVEIRDDGTMVIEVPEGTTCIIFDGGDSMTPASGPVLHGGDSSESRMGRDGGEVKP